MTLSIIVPVYKVEQTLCRCVDSILTQDFDDFELLLIDDGSPDDSGLMADDIAKSDPRVSVYHKVNGGLSDARNHGIERAKGQYVTFVDSDDEIAPGTLSALMTIIRDNPRYDILEYPVLQKPGYPDERLFQPGTEVYDEPLDWLARLGLEHCWACNKIYRRSLFDTVRFPFGKVYEDIYTLAELLKLKPVIACADQGLYLYHWNDHGIGAIENRERGLSTLLEAQMSLVSTLGIDTKERRWHRLYVNMLTSQLYSYRATGQVVLRPQRLSLSGYASRGDTIKALMVNTLGLRLSCKIFKLLSRL